MGSTLVSSRPTYKYQVRVEVNGNGSLAYYATATITSVKNLIVLARGNKKCKISFLLF
jgi:hypothetical protein